jgi:Flp pilus assembly protein TadG
MTHRAADIASRTWFGRRGLADASGQSLIEGALVMPFLIFVVLGAVELGSALRDQQVVSRLAREGANLISRDVALEDAADALASMSSRPVDFADNARMIFTVVKRGGTLGTNNYNQLVVYQRFEYGSYAAGSKLTTAGSYSPGPAPDYIVPNSDSNTSLRVTNAPAGLVTVPGALIYVTEIITSHETFTPLDRFGVTVPDELYSIAFF